MGVPNTKDTNLRHYICGVPMSRFVALTVLAVCLPSTGASEPLELTVSPVTTFITKPLDENSLPDYRAAWLERLRRHKVPASQNGAVLFWQTVGLAGVEEPHRHAFCQELGMSMPPEVGRLETRYSPAVSRAVAIWCLQQSGIEVDDESFDAYEQANPAAAIDAQLWPSTLDSIFAKLSFSASNVPPLTAWLERNTAKLDRVVASLDKPSWYDPPPSLCATGEYDALTLGLPTMEMRDVVESLAMRARISISSGNLVSATNDLAAIQRLSKVCPPDLYVDILVANGATMLEASPVELQLAEHPRATDEVLRRLQSHHALVAPSSAIPKTLRGGERLYTLNYCLALLQESTATVESLKAGLSVADASSQQLVDLLDELLAHPVDGDHFLAAMNQHLSVLEATVANGDTRRVLAALKQQQDELAAVDVPPRDAIKKLSPAERAQVLQHALIAHNLTSLPMLVTAEARHMVHDQLMHLAMALARYRLRHGDYPAELVALVPKMVPSIPRDAFGNESFGYHRKDGGYLLYSYGLNGSDDGGSSNDLNVLKGYCVGKYDPQIRELLGDETPGRGMLKGYIPVQYDDVSIRLPLVRISLPTGRNE